jgi:hypothetical protein
MHVHEQQYRQSKKLFIHHSIKHRKGKICTFKSVKYLLEVVNIMVLSFPVN